MLTSRARAGVVQPLRVPFGQCKARNRVVAKAYRQPFGSTNRLGCPYEVLGLDPSTADEAQIKRQYRKLAKQFHPDVSKDHTDSTPQFLNITQAYEFLLCQLRNKGRLDANGNLKPANSDAFHDWYWSFRMSRSWGRQQQAKADDGAAQQQASTPQSAEGLQSQLAGLRHRAAIRKQKAVNTAASEHESEQPQQEQQQEAQPAFFAAADGPSDSADPPPSQPPTDKHQPQTPRKQFINNSNVQEGLKQQLYGMRRKAALKREFGA